MGKHRIKHKENAADRRSKLFKGAAVLFSCGTILVAILGLVGWFSGILAFARISETFIPMAYSTAISFLVLGSIILIHIYKPHAGKAVVFSSIITLVVSIFGLLEVAEYFVGVSLNFEDMLFPEAGMLGAVPIARMSPSTGAFFFLAGIVLLLFLNQSKSKTASNRIGDFAGIMASCIIIASLTFVIGYIYGTPLLYTGKVIPMAATTAIAFLLLGFGMLAAIGPGYMPLRPMAGATMRARLLRIFVPLTVIMVLIQGVLHDIAVKHFAFSNVLLLAGLVMLSLAVVAIIVSQVARVVGGALDRAELSLNLRNRAIFHVTNGIIICKHIETFENPIVYVNPAFEQITGYSISDITGKDCRFLQGKDKDQTGLNTIRQALREQLECKIVLRNYRKDGTMFWNEANISPVFDNQNNLTHYVAVINDITDRKKAQEALQESERKFNAIANYTYDWESWHGPNGKLLWVNPAVENITGYSIDECMNMKNYPVEIVDQQDQPEAQKLFEDTFRNKTSGNDVPFRVLRKDGGIVWCAISWQPIYDSDNKYIGIRTSVRDIIERKRAQDALQESEAKYRSVMDDVLDSSELGLFILDSDFKVAWINHAIEDFFGLERDRILGKDKRELIRKRISDIFGNPQEFIDKVISTYDNNTYVERFECYVRGDGTRKERWLEHRSLPIQSGLYAGGRMEFYIDITGRKRAQEALLVSEEKFSKVFYASPDSITITSADEGQIIDVNEGFEHVLGYSRQEALGKTTLELGLWNKPQDRDWLLKMFWEEGRIHNLETTFYNKAGEILHCLVSGEKIVINNKPYILAVTKDITERKKAQAILQESEKKFNAIANYTYDWESWLGANGKLLWINPAVEKMTGYSIEECMNMKNYPIAIVDQRDRQDIQKLFEDAFENKTSGNDVPFRFLRKDGGVVWVAISWQPIHDSDNKYIGIRTSVRDITERKRAEEALEDKTKEMEHFTSIIRHDLGNPLLSIGAFAIMLDGYCSQLDQILKENSISQELKDQISSIVKSDIPEAVSFIQTSSAEMQKLLEGLKQVADVGRRTLKIEPQDVNEIIRQIVGKLNFQINDCGASVAVEPLSACLGDATQLNQVFSNLLSNALKYLDPNRKGSIRISSRIEHEISIYCIEDNGIGIAAAEKDKVFEIFHRVDPKGHVSGEGLGLTIVGRIIERHKGRIWLESELGKGSKFFVSLPTVCMADSTPKATESNLLTPSKEKFKQFQK